MTAKVRSALKNIEGRIENFHDGDILELVELETYFQQITRDKEKELKDNAKYKYFIQGFSHIAEIDDQVSFLREIPDFIRDVYSKDIKKAEKTSSIKTKKMNETFSYPEDYFSEFTDNTGILETFAAEANEHIEKGRIVLLDLEHEPDNEENINTLFRVFHTIKGSSAFLGIKNLEDVSHEAEDLLTMVRDGTVSFSRELADILFYALIFFEELVSVIFACKFKPEDIIENFLRINIFPLVELLNKVRKEAHSRKIGEILIEMGKSNPDIVGKVLGKQAEEPERKFGEIAVSENLIDGDDIAIAVQKQRQEFKAKNSYVRVSGARLNKLIDLVGELVVTQSIINSENGARSKNREQNNLASIASSIKDLVLDMGMVPMSDIFNRLRVAIRNTARELDKVVTVDIEGEDTELDRNLVEAIYDPLLHIVRNSVDHGIENPEERKKAGKIQTGKIFMSAAHNGGGITISVSDDGKGMDHVSILDLARQKKLIGDKEYKNLMANPKEALKMIFLPGFSTKKEVSSISGRGVGMDIVQKNLSEIQGRVEIISELGEGSTFLIKLPLTLAIIDGFVFKCRGNNYVFPFSSVNEVVVSDPAEFRSLETGEKYYLHNGDYVPLVTVSDYIFKDKTCGIPKAIVFIEYDNRRLGIIAEDVIGKQEIVIKKMNDALSHIKIFSGGAVFGDGSIGFIIDMEYLFNAAETAKESAK